MNIYRLPTPLSIHYLTRYINFIESIKTSLKDDNHIESHHILPQSMGGSNQAGNLILLTARQHYLAHWMLWQAYKSKEMTSAFFSMSNQSNQYQGRICRISSRTYEKLRKEFILHIAKNTTELWKDAAYRQKHIDTNNKEETKTLRSEKAKALWQNPDYTKKLLESRDRARAEGRVRTDHSKCSQPGDLNPMKRPDVKAKNTGANHYSNRVGYIRPICPHCGISTTPTNIKRWHGENCKSFKN